MKTLVLAAALVATMAVGSEAGDSHGAVRGGANAHAALYALRIPGMTIPGLGGAVEQILGIALSVFTGDGPSAEANVTAGQVRAQVGGVLWFYNPCPWDAPYEHCDVFGNCYCSKFP